MSQSGDKGDIFNTIGSFKSLDTESAKPVLNNTFSSINNKNDIIGFLLDVLRVVAGSAALKIVIGGMFTDLTKKIEPELKTELKKQLVQSNASEPLPANFKSDGVTTSAKSIDGYNKLKVDPNSANGSLIYGEPAESYDGLAYDAIKNSGNFESNSNNVSVKYIESSDSFQMKPNLKGSSPTVGEYFESFVDDTELLNGKEIKSAVMDGVYGTLANSQGKSSEQIHKELRISKKLEKALNDDKSLEITAAENEKLLAKADELAKGVVNYDMGCGLLPAQLSFDDFDKLIKNISGATDQFYVADQMEETVDQSSETPEATKENKETMKDGFFQKVIETFTLKITEAVTSSPQVVTLFTMMTILQNPDAVLSDDQEDLIDKFEVCIRCISKKVMAMIAEFIFAIAVAYLIKLIKPVIKKVIKEKINQFVGLIKSLTGANKVI